MGRTARDGTPGSAGRRPVTPRSRAGWSAIGATAVGLGAWIVLPMLTVAYRDTYPITDTWVMPAIAAVLISIAAILNAFVMWRLRERSILGIAAAVVTIPLALMFILVFVGEGLTGA